MSRIPQGLFFDLVSVEEVKTAYEMERTGYPDDEAASLEIMQQRQNQAPDLFLGAYVSLQNARRLIAYADSTLSSSRTFTHDSMLKHDAGSGPSSVCLHGLCVAEEYRSRGVASALLQEYVKRLVDANASEYLYARIILICHEELINLYKQVGFQSYGKSSVVHGSKAWYGMRLELPVPELQPAADLEPDQLESIISALRASGRKRRVPKPLESFPGGVEDIYTVKQSHMGAKTNTYDILCPREGCGCLILKKGVAKYVENTSVELDGLGHRVMAPFLPMPTTAETVSWWLIEPDMMAFENIGFSKTVDAESLTSVKRKLLSCADCDLGPLGWCMEGGKEFWLVCSRVGYDCA